jgi:hypothetical protein
MKGGKRRSSSGRLTYRAEYLAAGNLRPDQTLTHSRTSEVEIKIGTPSFSLPVPHSATAAASRAPLSSLGDSDAVLG